MSDYNEYLTANARLIILKELSAQPGGTANESILSAVLDIFGHHRSRDFVRQQMRALGDIGAVEIIEAGTVLIAKIKRLGRDHVEGRLVLENVQKPSEA